VQPKRHTLTAAVSLTALTLSLAACGGDDDPGTQADAAADGTPQPVTLTITTFNEFGYEELLEEYMQLNEHVTVEHRKADTADNARDALRNALGANSGASDIEAVEVDWLVEFMQYPDKFEDLSDPEVEGRWLDWKTEAATTEDGKLIGYGTDIGPEAICYRADLFEEAGLPTDREEVAEFLGDTWEDYFEAGRQFVANSDAAWYDSAGALWQGMINQVEMAYESSRPPSTTACPPASASGARTGPTPSSVTPSPRCSARAGCSVSSPATPRASRAGTSPTPSPVAAATGAAPT
jgi:cellobiose transport system substrate-binding protein